MDTSAESDERRDEAADEPASETPSGTPDGELSIPAGPGGYTQERIGDMVLQRLFDREPPARRIGRFVVLERIGRGGMGTVYAAYDEQLDRKVAVKVLSSQEGAGDVAQLRLQREAQAMARLSHPNVVTVHEVGESDDGVFVAMEFIRGQSLDAWIHREPEWREVLEVFTQAGRGLIAAHAAGLIHRDLKPHNVMRTDEGVVKVLDFGLARAVGEEPSEPSEPSEPGEPSAPGRASVGRGSTLDSDLTRTGAVLGTPAYMAPEQHQGRVADARSDQFSFCVALYEALYRRRPFKAATLMALVHAVLSGEIQAPPAESRVPAWVHRIVVRGLSLEPAERWPSMQVLVQQLERDPSRARRRAWAVAGLIGVIGLAGASLVAGRGESASCPTAEVEREGLWPAARQARIAAAFEATDNPLAVDTLTRVRPTIDAYVDALGAMREQACEAHRSGEHSDRLFDLRTACLDVRRAGIDELLTGLEGAEAATVDNAAWAAASLMSIDRCADTEALTAAVAPPEDAEVARQVQGQREALASAASRVLAGAYEEASARVEASLHEATRLGYAPLVAEAELALGTARMESYQPKPALAALTRALVIALRSGHDEVAVEALARRMWILADPLRRPAEALGDDEIADALLDKLGRPTRLQWLLLNNRGVAQFRGGQRAEAEGSYREALAALEAEGDHVYPVEHISTRFNLAMLLSSGLGEPSAAAEELRSARVRAVELLGPEHPRVGVISVRLAANLVAAGQYDAAREELDASLAVWSQSNPHLRALLLIERANLFIELRRFEEARGDAQAAQALADLDALGSVALSIEASARIGLGEVDEGIEALERAIAAEITRAGEDHETVAIAHAWAGHGLRLAGRLDQAERELEQARVIFARLGLDGPPHLGRQFGELATVYLARGALARAQALLVETQAAQDAAGFAAGNGSRAQLTKLYGDLRAARGDREGALAAYREACPALAARVGPLDLELAACRLAHARALVGDPAAARVLARQARDTYERLGEGFAAERAAAAEVLEALDRPVAPPEPAIGEDPRAAE